MQERTDVIEINSLFCFFSEQLTSRFRNIIFLEMRRCEVGSGFWCGNKTAVCVYGQMRCDQADDCFDGGTDEIGCPPVRNYTYGTFLSL